MSIKKIQAKKVTPTMAGWLGEAVDVYKETENGIPTGKLTISWLSDTGHMNCTSHSPEEKIDIFRQ